MADYRPISRQVHLNRGYCCEADPPCFYCPYRPIKAIPPMTVDPAIEAAMRSGEVTTIQSDRQSLIPQLTIGNLTIIYKEYIKE